jgi:hypothetical protein
MLIFLIAAMDNPYRGEFSVSADAYQCVLAQTWQTRITEQRRGNFCTILRSLNTINLLTD